MDLVYDYAHRFDSPLHPSSIFFKFILLHIDFSDLPYDHNFMFDSFFHNI